MKSSKLRDVVRIALCPLLAGLFTWAPFTGAEAAPACSVKKNVKSQASAEKDIVDTAVGAGNFSTLAKALDAAGLVETLKGEGPFTVFAPDDAAFSRVPAEALKSLLADKDKLTKVLTYHVVSGEVPAKKVMKLKSAKTLEGSDVSIKKQGDKVLIGDADVTATDIKCSNGVIHVIDKVLMPQ